MACIVNDIGQIVSLAEYSLQGINTRETNTSESSDISICDPLNKLNAQNGLSLYLSLNCAMHFHSIESALTSCICERLLYF